MTLRVIMSVLAGFFLLGGGGYAGYTYFTKSKPQTYIVCPSDTKQCKEGIVVGRISPSCAFAVCPEDRPAGNGGIKVLSSVSLLGTSTQTLEGVRENGGDYACDITTDTGVTGKILSSQGELRADFDPVVKPNVRAVPTHLLLGKSATYAWTGIKNSGITFVRGSVEGSAKVKDLLPFDYTLPQVFSCVASPGDSTAFVPPPDVTFTDINPKVSTSTPS